MHKYWPLLLVFFLTSCQKEKGKIQLTANNEWMVEEVLDHLRQLRQDMAEVKSEVKTMKVKLSELDLGVAAKPKIVLNDQNVLGSKKAKIAIVEFSDYECPFCARHASNVFPKIKKEFIDTGKLRYSIRDFPLAFHSNAKQASVAARCAGKQNKYWAMHKKLSHAKGRLSTDYYNQFADELKLNKPKFESCMKDKEVFKQVESDVRYGERVGVNGTPRFFLGKVSGNTLTQVSVINGAQSFESFSKAIKRLQE